MLDILECILPSFDIILLILPIAIAITALLYLVVAKLLNNCTN